MSSQYIFNRGKTKNTLTQSLSPLPLSRCGAQEVGLGVVDSSVDNTSWLWKNSLEKSRLRSWPSVYYSRGGGCGGRKTDKGEGEVAEEGGGGAAGAAVAANDPIYAVIDKHRRRRTRRNNNNIDGVLTCNFAHTQEQQGGPSCENKAISIKSCISSFECIFAI